MNKPIQIISWILLTIGGVISLYFVKSVYSEDLVFWGAAKIDFTKTGQFGDFLGGVVGTIFALAGTLLIFMSFNEQTKQNKRQRFETTFFELVNLHKDNVGQMNYTKFDNGELRRAENRKVFRLIFQEFTECFREVKKFSNSKNVNDYLLKKHKLKLESIIKSNNLEVDIIEMTIIDIAYNIVFFGLGEEGEIIIRAKFKEKYVDTYFYPLLRFIKLKPKKENFVRWEVWANLLKLDIRILKAVNLEFHKYRRHNSINNLSDEAKKLVYNEEYSKYYGGHQHRLGHYFRHLFHCFKYLDYNPDLSKEEKYFYGKILRAQLSTYEQTLVFINSLSGLGLKWELVHDNDVLPKKKNRFSNQFITKYNLIKNLPGYHIFGIRYKKYYPKVDYETEN